MVEHFELSAESIVTRIGLDASVRLLMASPGGQSAELVLNTTFSLTVDETSTTASPDGLRPGDLALLYSLRWRPVHDLELTEGELVLRGDRFSLSVLPDQDYESWELIRSDGAIVIGLAGGETSRNY